MEQSTFFISSLASMGVMGAIFGAIIDYVSQKFHVEIDPKIEAVEAAVLGANCGACGFPGCQGFAAAVVSGEAPVGGCTPGGAAIAAAVAEIMGVTASASIKRIAWIKCAGCNDRVVFKFKYDGVPDCRVAMQVQGGDKACGNGCMGLGSCVEVCQFDAMWMDKDGLPRIDPERCTACGQCVTTCPKQIIDIAAAEKTIHVLCRNQDKGVVVKKMCQIGCIGCTICVKKCPEDAMSMDGNVAIIDYDKCTMCGICVEKCPRKVILDSATPVASASAAVV